MHLTLKEQHVRNRSKRPYTSPRLEKVTPSAAKENLAAVLPKDSSVEQMTKHIDQLAKMNDDKH